MNEKHKREKRQRRLQDNLDRKNWYRAFVSSLILVCLIPVYLIAVNVSGIYGGHSGAIKALLIITEVVEAAFAVMGFLLISQEEEDKLRLYYRIYFYLTALLILLIARPELEYSHSVYSFLLALLFCFFVPVFVSSEQTLYNLCVLVMNMVITLLSGGVTKEFIEILIFSAGGYIISRIASQSTIRSEKLSGLLKSRTRTSEKDPLTDIYNRRGLDKRISVLWPYCFKNKIRLGIIELDIDYFKKFNDKFGHPAGDKCLKQIAKAIEKASAEYTEIIARTGGEEFIVFVQGLDEREIIELAMNIRNKVAELDIKHPYSLVSDKVTVSMGIAAIVPEYNSNFEEIYEKADKALYAAKENGRNCIVAGNKIYGRMKNNTGTLIPQ